MEKRAHKPTQQPSKDGYFAHPTAVIDPGSSIGPNTKVWHFCHIMNGALIGEGCTLGQNVFVSNGAVLGRKIKVQNNVSIYSGVVLEDDVFIGPSVVFTNVKNPRSEINRKDSFLQTIVHRGATIGANCTVLAGVRVGKYAFVGAGTVLTKDVPAFALVLGNPGRHIGWMSAAGYRLEFNDRGEAKCPQTGQLYHRKDNGIVMVEPTTDAPLSVD